MARPRPGRHHPAVRLLAERGIDLSTSEVHRLVTGTPERLSLAVLVALCDILQVAPNDLIEVTAGNAVGDNRGGAQVGYPSGRRLRPSNWTSTHRARLRPAE
jgi:DNA-binding Xre family transcriptional regulator